ncbi:MAG: 2TM domain-containing protein [Betaproteobacteria bacterium]|jgi:hypothetical protein|nr:2TM domain-containing protein [Betaproteobacteria bacterium]
MNEATSAESPGGEAGRSVQARKAFRRHVALYAGGAVALNAMNYFVGSGWWAFWPLAAWSMLLLIHYLRYKAASVDEEWVEERTAELRLKSYDRDHIENIAAHGPGAAAGKSEAERK